MTSESNTLDLEPNVFTQDDPRSIALSLKRSAEVSRPVDAHLLYQPGREMLPKHRRERLDAAKDELRVLFDRTLPRNASG